MNKMVEENLLNKAEINEDIASKWVGGLLIYNEKTNQNDLYKVDSQTNNIEKIASFDVIKRQSIFEKMLNNTKKLFK